MKTEIQGAQDKNTIYVQKESIMEDLDYRFDRPILADLYNQISLLNKRRVERMD